LLTRPKSRPEYPVFEVLIGSEQKSQDLQIVRENPIFWMRNPYFHIQVDDLQAKLIFFIFNIQTHFRLHDSVYLQQINPTL